MKVIKYFGPFASRITNVSMYNQKSHQISYFSIIFFFNRVVLQHKFKFLFLFFFCDFVVALLQCILCRLYNWFFIVDSNGKAYSIKQRPKYI